MSDSTSEPATLAGRSPRWWPLTAASITFLVVVWLTVFTWSGIRGSHPAYLLTLVVVGLLALVWAWWSFQSSAPPRSARRTWLARGGMVACTALVIGLLIYPRPLPAEQVAIDALAPSAAVSVAVSASQIRFDPLGGVRQVGLVFYPGAKVDPRAYALILRPIAEAGYTVVIVKPPYNIAFFAAGAAGDVVGRDDGIDRWVVGGHSLGGTVAAGFANRSDRAELAGLLLWASFPARSLADATWLDVLSVSASADGLATPAKIERSRGDLPANAEFATIEGATHAQFGNYGTQGGDGQATISSTDAQAQIVAATLAQLRRIEQS